MAHPEQVNFLNALKRRFPEKFNKPSVVDIGSLDINGNTRFLFDDPGNLTAVQITFSR